jgi:hypothetical protein
MCSQGRRDNGDQYLRGFICKQICSFRYVCYLQNPNACSSLDVQNVIDAVQELIIDSVDIYSFFSIVVTSPRLNACM